MTTAPRGRLVTFLLRAGFLAAALAIIAGILGMHIMTGAHSMAAHAMPAPADEHTATLMRSSPGHTGHGTPEPGTTEVGTETPAAPAVIPAAAAAGPPTCSPGPTCPKMSSAGTACVPAPGTTTLAAPVPGTAPCALPDSNIAAAAAGAHYSFSPDSPTPGELSISRT
ncbi:hypothetical protein [Arthrobacter bambusae]|uniref:hypothetical protein n=1 Tax=Arthrobacter bambusae TaxID=1338426 RepID=UPI0027801FBD|nr:hypothetical protein [Arthrobacter bambusae]MDQ0028718.1 hypothetical protein [Arthrobacter bambusae]MDQ0096488.1 hypothetical protein [Arthrobacter bambusae]